MKNLILSCLLFASAAIYAQPTVQPLSSGDYWRIKEYNDRLQQFRNRTVVEQPYINMRIPSGAASIVSIDANRNVGVNEVTWYATPGTNVAAYVVEYSRNNQDFVRLGSVGALQTRDGDRFSFRHPFNDDGRIYYRVGIIDNNGLITAYTPSVQLRDEEFTTKIYPTVVRTGQLYLQTAHPFDAVHVTNSSGQLVYQKGIVNATGTIPVTLPQLPAGMYIVTLLSDKQHQYTQKIFVE